MNPPTLEELRATERESKDRTYDVRMNMKLQTSKQKQNYKKILCKHKNERNPLQLSTVALIEIIAELIILDRSITKHGCESSSDQSV